MDLQTKIQYTIVAVIILAAIAWIGVKLWRSCSRKSHTKGGCCGCALSDTCSKPARKKPDTKSDSKKF